VISLRWLGSAPFLGKVKRGDLIVQVWEASEVGPNTRLLSMRRGRTKNGAPVTCMALERPKEYSLSSWSRFKKECAAVGLKFGKRVSAREIRDLAHQNRVLSLTSPEKLGG